MSVKNASTRSDQDSGNSGSLSGQSTVVGYGSDRPASARPPPSTARRCRSRRGTTAMDAVEGARRRVDLDEVLEVGVRKGERTRPTVCPEMRQVRADRGGVTVDQLLDEAQLMKPLVPILTVGPPGSGHATQWTPARCACPTGRIRAGRERSPWPRWAASARRGGNPNDHPASRAANTTGLVPGVSS